MRLLLKFALGIEILAGVLWTLLAATTRKADGFGLLGWFFLIFAFFAVLFVLAAVAYWRCPEHRRLSATLMVLPVVFWFLPLGLQTLAGGPVSAAGLTSVALVLTAIGLALCWLRPRSAAAVFPERLLRSRMFNWLIIASVVAGWMVLVLGGFYLWNNGRPASSTANPGWAIAYGVVFAAVYLTGLGIASLVASTWAWVSLRGGIDTDTRALNIAQLVIAFPGVTAAVLVTAWLGSQA